MYSKRFYGVVILIVALAGAANGQQITATASTWVAVFGGESRVGPAGQVGGVGQVFELRDGRYRNADGSMHLVAGLADVADHLGRPCPDPNPQWRMYMGWRMAWCKVGTMLYSGRIIWR